MSEGRCKSVYSYNGEGGGEITTLSFGAGEIIHILFSGDEGWWEGELNGTKGWFPASYVTKIQESEVSSTTSDEWNEIKTPKGEIYYVNTKTNESSWELPDGIHGSERGSKDSVVMAGVESLTLDLTPDFGDTRENHNHLQIPSHATTTVSEPSTPLSKKPPSIRLSPQSQSQPTTPQGRPENTPKRNGSTLSRPATPMSNGHSTKPKFRIHNGISYPDETEAKEQSLLQPGKFSYCDYFWSDVGDSHNYQSGYSVLQQKMLKEKNICKEMSDLFKAREALELQYAKGLTSIANSMHAMQEEGTLGETWKQVKAASLLEAKIHQDFANKLRIDIQKPLLDEKENAKKDLKKQDASMAEFRKQVHVKYTAAERAKQLLIERSKDLDLKNESQKYTKEEVNKARRKLTKQAEDLTHAVEAYNLTRQRWFEEMVTSSIVLERHEAARIGTVKSIISNYSKLLQDSTTKCHQSCDVIVQHLAITEADKDRELWVRKNATGKVKPVDLVL